MIKRLAFIVALGFAAFLSGAQPSMAQAPICPSVDLTCPAFTYGFLPSPAQWQNWWSSRQAALNYTPLNIAGGTMTGPLITFPSNTSKAGLNVPSGTAPSAPVNGDVWTTSLGAFWRINGITVGPINVMSATVGGLVPTPPNSATQFLNGTGVFSTPSGSVGANPTATAGPTAVNGAAVTYMRSDASPAIQKGSSSLFGIVEVDNTTMTASAGVISCATGTSSQKGCLSPDNSTITASSGVIAASQQIPSGAMMPYAGASAPSGWLLEFGQCVSKVTDANLYAAIGDTWTTVDSCGAGNFGIPDMRGRAVFGVDNMGGSSAGRLGSGPTGGITGTASLGASGGTQSSTLAYTNMPTGQQVLGLTASGASVATTGAGGSALYNEDTSAANTTFNNTPPAMVFNYIIKL